MSPDGCAGADAFLVKPLGAGEVAHLWQYMKQRRLPEGSYRRDLESLPHQREPHQGEDAGQTGGVGGALVEPSDGMSNRVEQGDVSECEIDVSAFDVSCSLAPSLTSCSTFAVASNSSSVALSDLPELSNLVPASLPRGTGHDSNNLYVGNLAHHPCVVDHARTARGIERRTTKDSLGSSVEAQRDPDEGPVGADCKQQ